MFDEELAMPSNNHTIPTTVTSAPSPTKRPKNRPHRPEHARYPTWGALRWLFLFRLLLVVVLVVVFSPSIQDPLIANADSTTAWRVLVVYAVMVLMSGLNLYARWPRRENQVYLAIFTDIIAFTLLMHAGGGVSSGLGILLAVSVAAGALMMEGRLSLLFAAFAALAVITQQTYAQLQSNAPASDYTQAGLLGMMFFAVALLAHMLYRRVRDMEDLAARRKVDIDDLSKLNEYIIQNMSTGILVVDGERRLRLMNQAAQELLGTPEAQQGTRLSSLSPPLSQWLDDHVRPTSAQGGLVHLEGREIKPSRQLLGDYRAAGVLLYLRDNQELAREAQQIKLASLGTLTASIAHNIRNPLSAISHAAQLLGEAQELTPDDRHLLDIVRRNSGRIEEIVSSVLQLSRRNQVDPKPLELSDWLEAFCVDFREAHGLSETMLSLDCEPPPLSVEVDPRHLHQIIANLCENAMIHGSSPQHQVEIQIRASLDESLDRVLVEVRDDGPGIDDESAREIFTPFYTTRSSGTGLGLYIARELAETNGIRLSYERTRPTGSCFKLEFS